MSIFKQIILLACLLMMKTAIANGMPEMPTPSDQILLVVTSHDRYPSRTDSTGLWLAELTHVYDVLLEAGYSVDLVSPLGGKVPIDPRSLGWLYLDAAAKARLHDPKFMALLQSSQAAADIDPAVYRAIFFTGGHGTMWDFRSNKALKRIAEGIYRHGGIVSSVCHGAAGLLDLEAEDGTPLIAGHRLTGFSNLEETLSGVRSQVPYLLQSELEAKGARYEKSIIPFRSYVVTDGRFVTGQNPGSSQEVALALLAALKNGTQP